MLKKQNREQIFAKERDETSREVVTSVFLKQMKSNHPCL